jgi:hypothetical protein
MKSKRGITIRFGPLGLSLLAAGITAVGVAAVSVADSGGGSGDGVGDGGSGARTFEMHGPPGGGPGVAFARPNLSEEDRQKLEEFRQCMQDSGAPVPPEPGEIDPSDPPEPPSSEDREKLEQAFETCKSKLPEDLQKMGPPRLHFGGCPPGDEAPGTEERGRNQNQSNGAGTSSSGSAT